jgi:predicted dithiol-disulfide oxidoreductase (DUF899 family)
MDLPEVTSREDWEKARIPLLAKEKEHTKARDALHAERQAMPMFPVDKEYVFDTPDGKRTLNELFDGRHQLIVYHFMRRADSGDMFCPVCSFWIDSLPHLAHLHARDTSLVVDCPEPLDEVLEHKERMGWTQPFVSSYDSPFYDDFSFALLTEEKQVPGISVFVRDDDGNVFCAYSTRDRGPDTVNNTYNYLDLTPLGRQEKVLPFKWAWIRYHDEFDA